MPVLNGPKLVRATVAYIHEGRTQEVELLRAGDIVEEWSLSSDNELMDVPSYSWDRERLYRRGKSVIVLRLVVAPPLDS